MTTVAALKASFIMLSSPMLAKRTLKKGAAGSEEPSRRRP